MQRAKSLEHHGNRLIGDVEKAVGNTLDKLSLLSISYHESGYSTDSARIDNLRRHIAKDVGRFYNGITEAYDL